jgi:hypothetical protein
MTDAEKKEAKEIYEHYIRSVSVSPGASITIKQFDWPFADGRMARFTCDVTIQG